MERFDEMLIALKEQNLFYYNEYETQWLNVLDNTKPILGGQYTNFVYETWIEKFDELIIRYGDILISFIIEQLDIHKHGILNADEIDTLKNYIRDFYRERFPKLIEHIKNYYKDYPDELEKVNKDVNRFEILIIKINNKLKIELNKYNTQCKYKAD